MNCKWFKFYSRSLLTLLLSLRMSHLGSAQEPTKTLITEERADAMATELLAKMTTEEKQLQLLSYRPNGVPRLGIPNLNAGEALHGVVSGGCTSFPMSIALGATWDPELVKQVGTVISHEGRAVGLEQAFAPMLGLARDPRWGRVEESYGEDPYLVSRIGVAYVEGMQGTGADRFGPNHVICTAKHFVADGEPWAGANGEDFEISDRVLREVYFPPFEAVVKEAQIGSIMPAHHALNGVPCHANAWLLDTILRKEWGFLGFVTSDMGDIPKVTSGHKFAQPGDAAVKCLSAGVDMELIGALYEGDLSNALKENKISIDVVNEAARRVLRAKIQLLGLLPPNSTPAAEPSTNETQRTIQNHKGPDDIWAQLIAQGKFSLPENLKRADADQVLHDPAHEALALKAAQEEIVLLKNDPMSKGGTAILPLDKGKINHLLVVGPLADMVNLGGYSGSPRVKITIREGLMDALGKDKVVYQKGCELTTSLKPNDPELAAAVTQATGADAIVVVVGFTRGQAGENLDRDNLELIGGQEGLVEAMQATGKPVVVVLSNGAPLVIPWIKDHVPAIVEAWYGGQAAGTAVAQTLFGDVNPGGKLNVSFPRSSGQIPCYYNHYPLTGPINYFRDKDDPFPSNGKNPGVLFSFGHGLSYTSFAYENLKVEPDTISNGQTAQVSFSVKNTGSVVGDEVAQMYLHQEYTSLVRPVLCLQAFQRMSLKPGESRTVSFPIGFDQVKFWKDGAWVAEPGKIEIHIGSASDDLRLNGSVIWK